MKNSILFITCDEAKHICDRRQYGEASAWDKFKLNVRLSWCKVTRAYSNRNKKLTEVINSCKTDHLNDKERTSLEKKFNEELAKH